MKKYSIYRKFWIFSLFLCKCDEVKDTGTTFIFVDNTEENGVKKDEVIGILLKTSLAYVLRDSESN